MTRLSRMASSGSIGLIFLAVGASGATLALAVASVEHLDHVLLYTWVSVTALLCFIPLGVGLVRHRVDLFEPSMLVGVFYLVGFPIPALMAVAFGQGFDPSVSLRWFPHALGVAALGIASWLLGYYLGPGAALASVLPRVPGGWCRRRLAAATAAFAAAGWTAQILLIVGGGYLHGFRTAISPKWATTVAWTAQFAIAAIALAAVQYFRAVRTGRGYTAWMVVLGGLLIAELAFTIPSGNRVQLLMTLAVPVMCAYYVFERTRWKPVVVVGLVAVFLVFPLEDIYRSAISRSADINARHPTTAPLALLERAAIQTGATLSHSRPSTYAMLSVQTFVQRLNMIGVVASVIRRTPSVWPFADGRTVDATVVSLAPPRFIMKKPIVSVGGMDFAHRYLLVRPWDTVTSVAVTRIGELYLNSWWPGVAGGMWLEGMLTRFIYVYLVNDGLPSPSGVFLYVLFALTFAQFSSFADYALFLKEAVILVLAVAWLSESPRREHAAASIAASGLAR